MLNVMMFMHMKYIFFAQYGTRYLLDIPICYPTWDSWPPWTHISHFESCVCICIHT